MQVPERTCVSCREKKARKELYRLVVLEERLCYDAKGRLGGRGMYLCQDKKCIDSFLQEKKVKKFFKRNYDGIEKIKELLTMEAEVSWRK